MSPQPPWHRVTALFEAALEKPVGEREAWIEEKCSGDAALKGEVSRLLTAHEQAEGRPTSEPATGTAAEAATGPGSVAAGERVGRYRIVAEIGRGGMGIVYKAEDPRLHRFVALKFLPPYLAADDTAKERLLSEARAASALDHANICTVHDVGETADGRLFFAMAYYEGRSLQQRLATERLSEEEAIRLAIDVAEGLMHAHDMGVVHRDVKPSNIYLPARGGVKILDFGLAKRGLAPITEPGLRLGTLAYMSPEQAQGLELDHRTDIWSLGVVLWEMLTGALPFQAESQGEFFHALLHLEPGLTATGSRSAAMPTAPGGSAAPLASWSPIVRRALEKTPSHRYQRMHDLRTDLAALSGQLRAGASARSSASAATARRAARSVGVAGATESSPLSSGLAQVPGLVGRIAELEELRTTWEDCRAGHGLLACVTGEPGMGKTTLVEDFLAEVATGGGVPCYIARGRCSDRLAGSEAYLPILEALESLIRGEGRDLVIRLMRETAPSWYVRIAPVPAASDPALAEVLADAKAATQERLKRELTSFLQELARRAPVIVFCDDLHWADISSVDLISYVASRGDNMRLLLVGTYRPSDLLLAKHPFLEVQRELQGRGLCREVATRLLSEPDIAAYLDLEFPGHELPDFLPSLIHRRTEGNPLFMADLLRDLRVRGVIERRDGSFRLVQSADEIQRDLPESTRGMIERKIARLADDDRTLLVCAAVQGYEFDSATVATALELDVGEVEERLEPLARRHRFVAPLEAAELPDGTLTQRYRFVHVLYQDALAASLRPRQRATLSAAVAAALLDAYGDSSTEIASRLAYLFEAARQFAAAADHFLIAARHAMSLDASREGLILARRALAAAERLRGRDGLERSRAALQQLGQVHVNMSQLEAAIPFFERAEKAAVELGDVDRQVDAICSGALVHFHLKRTELAGAEARRALELARSAGSELAAASADVILGLERLCQGAVDEAEASFERSVPLLRREGPPVHALEAMGLAGLNQAWQLDYSEADTTIGWTLGRAREEGLPYHIILCHFVRGMSLLNQGRLAEGMADLTEGAHRAEQNDETYWLSRYPNTLGWAYHELQDEEQAFLLNTEGVRVSHDNGHRKPEANSHLNLAQFHLDMGELPQAFEHLQEAERIFEEDIWFRWRYKIRLEAELCRYWLRRGETVRAGACAAESLALAEPRRARKYVAWGHKLLGDVAVAEERFDDARREYDLALAVLEHRRCPTVEWKILLAAADMAGAYKQRSLAERYRGRCQAVLRSLADSLTEDRMRRQFLGSRTIRAALIG